MGILTEEQKGRISGTIFEQVGEQCQAASEMTNQRYKLVSGLFDSLPSMTEGNPHQTQEDMLLLHDISGDIEDIFNQALKAIAKTRRTVFSSVIDNEVWNQADASGKISKYELIISYCIFNQILD